MCVSTETGSSPENLLNGSIIFSDLDIVLCEGSFDYDYCGFNSALAYPYEAEDTGENSLLYKLYQVSGGEDVHELYYNCPINNSLAIDLSDSETLLDAAAWYDYNNKNNNFVISEIDADYLSKGIRIAKSSKLN